MTDSQNIEDQIRQKVAEMWKMAKGSESYLVLELCGDGTLDIAEFSDANSYHPDCEPLYTIEPSQYTEEDIDIDWLLDEVHRAITEYRKLRQETTQ